MQILDSVYLVGSGEVGMSDAGDCHVYLVNAGSELVLIDAGGGENSELILDNVAHYGFDPFAIRHVLLTHAHRDHANGVTPLRRMLTRGDRPSFQVSASAAEARLLAKGSIPELGLDRLPIGNRSRAEFFPPFDVDRILVDGETFAIGSLQITAVQVPGHNPGCLCYWLDLDGRKVLFSGDVVYHNGLISVGNWPGTDVLAYQENLKKLDGLGVDALLAGHLLWTVRGGQAHIDKANRAFAGLWPPMNINYVL
jgi:glyoxylase-like metal-dependent hydrolase (beta-lactamase superfamily II)